MAAPAEALAFRHEPLPDPNTWIRLLRVVSIVEDEDAPVAVHCELTAHPVSDAPDYLAISYTWGDEAPPAPVLLGGRRLDVRLNCQYVLRQTRAYAGGRRLWVDAICINQADDDEKSAQVAMMGDVFRKAAQVLACVGPHDEHSAALYRMLRTLGGKPHWRDALADPDWTERLVPDAARRRCCATWPVWRIRHRHSTLVKLFGALHEFFRRPYFHRLWVYQELLLGKNVRVFCGGDSMPLSWTDELPKIFSAWLDTHKALHLGSFWLRLVLPFCFLSWPPRTQTSEWYKSLFNMRPLREGVDVQWSRVPLRVAFKRLNVGLGDPLLCQDPRDRVYGILSLVSWGDKEPIRPDYKKDAFDLAVEVLGRFLEDHEADRDTRPAFQPLLRDAIKIARGLELDHTPTQKMTAMARLRQSPAPVELSRSEMLETVGTTVDRILGDRDSALTAEMRFVGAPLVFQHLDGTGWHWRLEGVRYPITTSGWDRRAERGDHAKILLPTETQSGDYLLISTDQSGVNLDELGFAFLARSVGGDSPDQLEMFELVGKALALEPYTPSKSSEEPWEKSFMKASVEFKVRLDLEDLFFLSQSCEYDALHAISWHWKDQEEPCLFPTIFFKSRLCRERFSSFAYIDRRE